MCEFGQCSRFVVGDASTLTFAGRSSTNRVEGRATEIHGYIEAAFVGGQIVREPFPRMHLSVPVSQIFSADRRQDSSIRRLIGGRVNPDILADLKTLTPSEAPHTYIVSGSITVNGALVAVVGRAGIDFDGANVRVYGTQVLDIRRFGIEIPRVLMFAVNPEVAVVFDIVAQREERAAPVPADMLDRVVELAPRRLVRENARRRYAKR